MLKPSAFMVLVRNHLGACEPLKELRYEWALELLDHTIQGFGMKLGDAGSGRLENKYYSISQAFIGFFLL